VRNAAEHILGFYQAPAFGLGIASQDKCHDRAVRFMNVEDAVGE